MSDNENESSTHQGTVVHIGETEEFSGGFTKRILVLESGNEYPQQIPFEFVKARTALCDKVQIGDTAIVRFDIRGREHNGKYYCSLNAWKLKNLSGGSEAPVRVAAAPPVTQPPLPTTQNYSNEEDDIPF